jgi:hypothetical protein
MSNSKSKKSTKPKTKVKIVETKLGRRQSLGLWEKVNESTSMIAIDERLKGFQRLLIVVHEALHEACRDWTEEKVVSVSEFLASVLWKCDYRHVDHSGEDKPTYRTPVKKKKEIVVRNKKYGKKTAKARTIRNPGSNSTVDKVPE